MDMVIEQKIRRCFLKDKSPSCGVGCRTQFSQETNAYRNSNTFLTGVTAALLIREGIIIEEITNFSFLNNP